MGMADPRASALEYRPQIDTLRALAVGSVMFEHYLPYYFRRLGLIDGVLVFFSISGYLITGILLKYKDAAAGRPGGFGAAFGTFYARRVLRIFPAYYLLLFLLAAAGAVQQTFWWHATYTTNIWTALTNRWDPDAGHFWSLAVEEQFYLVWPFVLLLAPGRVLPWIMGAGVACGVLFRFAGEQTGMGLGIISLPIANFDALFGGALLAWSRHVQAVPAWWRKYGWLALLGFPALFVLPQAFKVVWEPTMIAAISVYLIDQCVNGYRGWLGWFFSNPVTLYLGKISYGLYLYHYVVPHYLRFGVFAFAGGKAQFVAAFTWGVVSIACAMVSWHLFEKPINGLKSRFKMPAQAASPQGATAAA
jgi:peptidoglycan/LPS O-acetylase OafA/YrhL